MNKKIPLFVSIDEKNLSDEFLKNGYIIRDVENKEILESLRIKVVNILLKKQKIKNIQIDKYFNFFHRSFNIKNLNSVRLKIINSINKDSRFREMYYFLFKNFLDQLVGNELSMQNRLNFSIQFPNDSSSLLPLHSDVWSGDSPFEVVAWLPFVNVFNTKSMYILPPKHMDKVHKILSKQPNISSEKLYSKIINNIRFIDVKYGQILLFNQTLPHGNVINKEKETRWSINCRFKGAFTPYGDKKIGEFFQPISLKAASIIGMKYKLPKFND